MNQTTSQKRYQKGNQAKRRQGRRKRAFLLAAVLVALLLLWLDPLSLRPHKIRPQLPDSAQPEMDVELLTVNPNSRPGKKLGKVKGIVVHYTANPGSSAMDNRNYFEGLKDSHVTQASAHFIVGLKGEIVQCIPTSEIAYASNQRNGDTIAIEVCHPDASGKFNRKTYDSLVRLTAYLMARFDLDTDQVIRHYDVTGKLCPKYFVEHPDAWKQFKTDLNTYIKENAIKEKSGD